jgi:hypothetical protein
MTITRKAKAVQQVRKRNKEPAAPVPEAATA